MTHTLVRDYYDLLRISPDAVESGIDDAYERARAMYGKDSVAFYSILSNEQREAMLAEITDAYNTLKDPVKRKAYDERRKKAATAAGVTKENSLLNLYKSDVQAVRDGRKVVSLEKPLPVMDENDPMTVEQYRILYTKLEQISSINSFKCFAITSAVKGEGKTSTCMNMAWLIANEFKKKVLIIEGDLKNPSLSAYFVSGLPKKGLIDVVKGSAEMNDSIVQVDEGKLHILPAGGRVKNSSEFLSSNRMNKLLSSLKEEFDYMIIDSPPIISLADMNILSKLADGIILVVRAGETPRDVVLKAANSVKDKTVGLILNGAEHSMKKYERYYYY